MLQQKLEENLILKFVGYIFSEKREENTKL